MRRPTYMGPHLISLLPNISPVPLRAEEDFPVPVTISREQADVAMLE